LDGEDLEVCEVCEIGEFCDFVLAKPELLEGSELVEAFYRLVVDQQLPTSSPPRQNAL
jgi:hypothetical protein